MVYNKSFCCEVTILFFHFKAPLPLQLILKINNILLLHSPHVITKSEIIMPYKTTRWTREELWHGCYSQRFLDFPDFFLTTVKLPWPTELTIAQISSDNLWWTQCSSHSLIPCSHLLIYAFSQTHAVYMNW